MSTPRRQAWVLAIAIACASSWTPAWAQFPWSSPPALSRPPGQAPQRNPDAMTLGTRAELLGDLASAAVHYESAFKTVVAQASSYPPEWENVRTERLRAILPRYGRVMTALGRLAEAEVLLEHLMALPPTPAPRSGDIGFDGARRALNEAFALARTGARGLDERLVIDGAGSEEIGAALRFQVPPTEVPAVLLAELRLRQGRKGDVLLLWQREFRQYLQATARPADDAQALSGGEAVAARWHMALALQAAGAGTEARAAISAALDQDLGRLRYMAGRSPSPEAQLGGFQQHRWMAASALQLALQAGVDQKPADASVRLALGAIASGKGLVNRFSERRRALLATLDDRKVRRARTQVEELEADLPQLSTDGEQGIKAWVDWVNRHAAALEPALSALREAGLADVVVDPAPLLARIQAVLAPGEALVGFVLHQPLTPQTNRPEAARYVRYTLSPTGASLKDVGQRQGLDRRVASWRATSDAARQLELGQSLARDLLGALPSDVSGSTRWVIDPDGLLSLLPFEALPDPSGGLVLDRRTVRYVTSLAQLADPRTPRANATPTALVLADPSYPTVAAVTAPAAVAMRTAQGRAWRDMVFQPLPETRIEGEAVRDSLRAMGVDAKLLMGADATPTAMRRAAAPTYLHVASHGFVLAPAPESDPQATRRIRMLVPGLLAGLALAPDRQGAVLTGSELEALDLHGTRLVVLSACDTGNGSIDVHEGLTSLRRAAEEAGAGATLTSLWSVPSQATTRLMTHFYGQLAAGQGLGNALRSAKLAVRQSGGSVRDWAGFVLAGADQ